MTRGTARTRLDRRLVDEGLAASREEARELIERGAVTVNGVVRDKPSSMTDRDATLRVARAEGPRWASRGAHKLLRGLDVFAISPAGKLCADIGASTGGFTHVLLSRGASRVAAIDVGYGQLAWELRSDPRVLVLERTNARAVSPDEVGWLSELIVMDASFISLRLLLPNVERLMAPGGDIVALVKPQFEVGREHVGRGVVRDPALHLSALTDVARGAGDTGLRAIAATWSPIRGPEGNIEFIYHIRRASETDAPAMTTDVLEHVVSGAHEAV